MKKYYSISEASNILQIFPHQLRYLEKVLPKLSISKMKGRRYYTVQNIEFIRSYYKKSERDITILARIENLIAKFSNIASSCHASQVLRISAGPACPPKP